MRKIEITETAGGILATLAISDVPNIVGGDEISLG